MKRNNTFQLVYYSSTTDLLQKASLGLGFVILFLRHSKKIILMWEKMIGGKMLTTMLA